MRMFSISLWEIKYILLNRSEGFLVFREFRLGRSAFLIMVGANISSLGTESNSKLFVSGIDNYPLPSASCRLSKIV